MAIKYKNLEISVNKELAAEGLTWYVVCADPKKNRIEAVNVFDYKDFAADVQMLMGFKKNLDRQRFAYYLKCAITYHFSRDEIIIVSPHNDSVCEKMSISSQLMMNFNAFSNYVWNF